MSLRVLAVPLRSGTDADANRAAATRAVLGASPLDAVPDGRAPEAATPADCLVVLPEYAARFDPRGVGPEHAEPVDGPFVRALRAAAARAQVTVVAGTVLPGAEPDRAVNAVVAVGPDGTVLGEYRKVHLYDAFGQRESDRFEAGAADAEPLVVEVGGLRVGVMTCYDLRFPESARRLVDAGATVIVVPAAWAAGDLKADQWRTLLRARAIESCAYVVGAAQQGRGVTGACLVVDPHGVVLAEAPAAADPPEAGVAGAADLAPAVAVLDPEVVRAARERNPSLDNRRYVVVPGRPGAPGA